MEEDSMALLLFTYLGTQAPLSQQMLKDPHLCWHGHIAFINFEEWDEVDPDVWHCPRKFSSRSAKSSRSGNVFMPVPELAKEHVLIKMIFFCSACPQLYLYRAEMTPCGWLVYLHLWSPLLIPIPVSQLRVQTAIWASSSNPIRLAHLWDWTNQWLKPNISCSGSLYCLNTGTQRKLKSPFLEKS